MNRIDNLYNDLILFPKRLEAHNRYLDSLNEIKDEILTEDNEDNEEEYYYDDEEYGEEEFSENQKTFESRDTKSNDD